MKKLQAFKFQLRPTGAHKKAMKKIVGCCRFVYNEALAYQKKQYEENPETKFSYTKLANRLPELKKDPHLAWLADAPSQALQQSLKNLETAYTKFFRKEAQFPRFKKKGQHDSFRIPQGFEVDQENSRIFLPKLGWIRYRNSRKIVGKIKNITITFSHGRWYASIQTECEIEQPVHAATSSVGVDVGIAKFATLSTGQIFKSINSFKNKQKQLARYQRIMSRRVRFSNNWKKAKKKVSNLHKKIANIRNDYLHQTSNAICKNHALVVIEDLKIKNMSKSASGSFEQPGRKVKAKSGLNKSILDQGWYELRRQFEYKQYWRGGLVVVVNAAYTSQKCSCCGYVSKDNRKVQEDFSCMNCRHAENADVNAAKNILAAGLAVLACGEIALLGDSMNQEPPEMIQAKVA
jgi:putative transposase